jgi:hypothetical protein
MNAAAGRALETQPWKDLFQVAICESNVDKLPERIDDAEAALVIRERQLYYTAEDDFEEKESLDDAMCILHSLRRSLKRGPPAVQSRPNLDSLRSA